MVDAEAEKVCVGVLPLTERDAIIASVLSPEIAPGDLVPSQISQESARSSF